MAVSFVQQFLTGIADAGRELLEKRWGNTGGGGLRALCDALLTQRGEVLGTALARELVATYNGLDEEGRRAFFSLLRDAYGPDRSAVDTIIAAYQQDPGPATMLALSQALQAPRQRLIRAVNMAPGGTAAVISMRRDLQTLARSEPGWEPVEADFAQLLGAWFNRGFLRLARIDWQTPAHILEKLISYESVHAIHGWDDLRRRLDADRRCFAFFHPALPDEPLIFVEVALVNGLALAIQPLLDRDGPRLAPAVADTAIFYSINNCQAGLRGISFGNLLIKQVVSELEAELPNLRTFATLSPLPGFGRWLAAARAAAEPQRYGLTDEQFQSLELLDHEGWHQDAALCDQLRTPLLALGAYFLLRAQNDNGMPLDPVARFHLGNGATLERINWLGDVSAKGLSQSAGLLVNYRYDLKRIVENHEAFQNEGRIVCSRAVQRLLLVKAEGKRSP